jgi:hypothetical protein
MARLNWCQSLMGGSVVEDNYDGVLMADTVEALILDLLEWIGPDWRPYAEVLDAWRTSCPRLPVWEDANDRGFVTCRHEVGPGRIVSVSDSGRAYLAQHRPLWATSIRPASGPSRDTLGVPQNGGAHGTTQRLSTPTH